MSVSNMKTFVLATIKPLICSLRLFYENHVTDLEKEIADEKVKVNNLSNQVTQFATQVEQVMNSPAVSVTAESLQQLQINVTRILETLSQLQSQVNEIDRRFNS